MHGGHIQDTTLFLPDSSCSTILSPLLSSRYSQTIFAALSYVASGDPLIGKAKKRSHHVVLRLPGRQGHHSQEIDYPPLFWVLMLAADISRWIGS
jgi:hypothetical protein